MDPTSEPVSSITSACNYSHLHIDDVEADVLVELIESCAEVRRDLRAVGDEGAVSRVAAHVMVLLEAPGARPYTARHIQNEPMPSNK
jgi:hypothetical protein